MKNYEIKYYLNKIPHGWDEWVIRNQKIGGFAQISTWARISGIANRTDHLIIEVLTKEGRVGGALCIIDSHYFFKKYIYISEGPTIKEGENIDCIVDIIINSISNYFKRYSIQIYINSWPVNLMKDMNSRFLNNNIHFNKYLINKWSTSLVDLNVDNNIIFDKLHRSARKAIRKCEKQGVIFSVCDNFLDSYELFHENITSIKNVRRIDKNLKKIMWESGQNKYYKYYIALSEKREPLAYLATINFNSMSTEISSAITDTSRDYMLPAQDYLHWRVLIDSKERGSSLFNMAGFNPESNLEKEIGIKRFKEKWGGDIITYPKLSVKYGINLI